VPSLPLDDANRPLFTVGQVSEMLKVQQAFLRRLDEFDVVSPSRSAGGQRRYTRNEIVAVSYVVELVDNGLTLPAIRRVLELEAELRESEARLREAEARLGEAQARLRGAEARLGEAQGRLRELAVERDELRSALARLAAPQPGQQTS
jgi:MerR family transcriptional regulator, heat shock protein HspR